MIDSTMDTNVSIMIAGVGGQGILLAGDVLARIALHSDLDVKKSEVRGLSRRFGSVWCQVHMGRRIESPIGGLDSIDYLLGFETGEALRYLPYLKDGGTALVNRLEIGKSVDDLAPRHSELFGDTDCIWLDGSDEVANAGCSRNLNVFMLGAFSQLLHFGHSAWQEVLSELGDRRSRMANLRMFEMGTAAFDDANRRPVKPK